MKRGVAIDPAPHVDLPSDVRFKLWLSTLTPEQVERDRRAGMNTDEKAYTRAALAIRPRRPLY